MPSNYPTTLDTFTPKTDGIHDVMAADVNNLQNAVVAIEQAHISPGDWPLKDSVNGDHFQQFASSYPSDWTQVNAAGATNTNLQRSFWLLLGSSVTTFWKYRKLSGITTENIGANVYQSFVFGPIHFRDFAYGADVTYKFGVYRNNGGVIDETAYVRGVMKYVQASAVWQFSGEEHDGTTPHTSTPRTMSWPLLAPIYIRLVIRNASPKLCRVYMGQSPLGQSQTRVLSTNQDSTITWGNVFLQIEQSRGAGDADTLLLGAVDMYILD